MRPLMRSGRFTIPAALAVAVAAAFAPVAAFACPFCSAVSQTFSEEMGTMDVAVIAKLVKAPPPSTNPGDELAKATFEVTEILKGDTIAKPGDKIETLYFGDGSIGKSFLVMGIDPPKIMWSTPLPLTDKAREYLHQLTRLPKDGPDRLAFFQKFLEDSDEILARDAYDEFARAPYSEVKELKDRMNHDQIIAWIKNPEIPASRRRLYFVMLGVCGTEKDVPLLEELMSSSDRKARSGLDALVACYLTLRGEEGLKFVEELFLANKKADYADTYSAIMAIRFHGTEGGVIDTKRLVKSLHHLLERPELADLVIPDLARWEDWGAMDKLFELFKTADEKSSWVRVPVINYLRACPLPRAKELLKECEKIDPAAMKRANSFFPVGPSQPAPSVDKATSLEPASDTEAEVEVPRLTAATMQPAVTTGGAVASAAGASALAPAAPPDEEGEQLASVNRGAAPPAALKKIPDAPPNLWAILGVPWAVGLSLALVQWTVLRGRR